MSDFKDQSPWGSPPPGGNGDGGFRRGPTPPDIEELIKKAPNAPNLHRIPKKDELRIVTIQDCESIPCGGTHVEKLGEIKKIVFNKIEPTENGYKIFYDVK